MKIAFIGHGYVGLVTAAVFADLGNLVWVVGRTKGKIEKLKMGIPPFYEPGLTELVKRNLKAGRLKFTLNYNEAIPDADVVFIAVGIVYCVFVGIIASLEPIEVGNSLTLLILFISSPGIFFIIGGIILRYLRKTRPNKT